MVLVSWPGHSDYKKYQKKYIIGKKRKKCIKKLGQEINRVACKLARTPRYKKKTVAQFLKKQITFSNSNEKKIMVRVNWYGHPSHGGKSINGEKKEKNIKKSGTGN